MLSLRTIDHLACLHAIERDRYGAKHAWSALHQRLAKLLDPLPKSARAQSYRVVTARVRSAL